MVKSKNIRCGLGFLSYTKELKKRGGVSTAVVTDNLAAFLEEEGLTPVLLKRAEQYKRVREKGMFR